MGVTPENECEAIGPPGFTPEMAFIYQESMPDPYLTPFVYERGRTSKIPENKA
jgi:hypothetical protein